MSDPWFKFFPSDWLGGTRTLTATETGVYITLVCMMHETQGPIVDDRKRLARLCGCPVPAFSKAISALIEQGKIAEENGFLTNAKVEKQLSERGNFAKKARMAALKRWETQVEKTEQNQCCDHANASTKQCLDDAIPEARSQKPDKEERAKALLSSDDDAPDLIDIAFDAYNEMADRAGLTRAQSRSPKRRSALKKRLGEAGGINGWMAAIEKVEQSDFLTGKRQTKNGPFFADLDFILQQSSFTKIMEGSYDNRNQSYNQQSTQGQRGADPALENIARIVGLGSA